MAKVGYRKPYYKLLGTEGTAEAKSAGMGVRCEVTINAPETKLYADDGVAESVREFVDGSITAEFDDILPDVMADLTGAKAGSGNELIFNADDVPPFVRFGYINKRIKNSLASWRVTMYYKVQFSTPGDSSETKGQNTTFKTDSLSGSIFRDDAGNWKYQKDFATLSEAETALKAIVKSGAAS